jgi:hypothetical protein
MATKIGVLNPHQISGATPAYHITKSEAEYRVLSGVADRLTHWLIRMKENGYALLLAKTEKMLDMRRMVMPPKELPGIYFKFLRKLHNPEQISLT